MSIAAKKGIKNQDRSLHEDFSPFQIAAPLLIDSLLYYSVVRQMM